MTCQQAVAGISHISFAEEESVSPRKPTSLPEVAKQRELSGTLESEADAKLKKQLSDAKCKELSGHDIFAPPPEILPRPTTARALDLKGSIDIGEPVSRNVCTSVKVSNGSGVCGCMHIEIRHFLPQLLMIFLRNICVLSHKIIQTVHTNMLNMVLNIQVFQVLISSLGEV